MANTHQSSLTTASPFAKVERPPMLALSLNNIGKLQNEDNVADDLRNMWSVFSKCKGSLQDGERLENLSWRLWSRQGPFLQSDEELSMSDDSQDHASISLGPTEHAQQEPPSDPEDGDWESDSSDAEAGSTTQSRRPSSSLAPPAQAAQTAIPMGARSAPRSPSLATQSSTSAPTRPPLQHTASFQKRKKHRSGSFQSAKHKSLTTVELQELLSTILPMRIPEPSAASGSPHASAADKTPSPSAPAPLPVVTPPQPPTSQRPLQSDSSQRDSNSSIESRFSEEGLTRITPGSDTSLEGLSAVALDRTPRPPMHKLPEAEDEDKHTPRTDMHQAAVATNTSVESLQSQTQEHQSQPSIKVDDGHESSGSKKSSLKHSHSSASGHGHHHHHSHHHAKVAPSKRPSMHRKAHSTKLSLSRNASAKNVRILEDTVVDTADTSDSHHDHALTRSTSSRSSDHEKSKDRLSGTSSSTSALAMASQSKSRTSLQDSSHAHAVPVDRPHKSASSKASASNCSSGPASSEPKSVVRGFEAPASLGTSPQPPPRVPFCSPALGPPPKCKFASGPPPMPPTPGVAEPVNKRSPQPTPSASPTKKTAPPPNRRKFFLGAASASDSDEMAKSPEHHHAPSYQSMSRPSLPTNPSSLKNEQHFPQAFEEPIASTSKSEEVADDADDSSGWGSDFTEDESGESPAGKGKARAALEPQRQQQDQLFIKRVPTAPGQLNRVESRTGLLTQLFKPSAEDVRAVDTMLRQQRSQANLVRNHSAVGLMSQHADRSGGGRKGGSPPGKKLQQSKSAVALPVMSYERGDDFPAFEQPKERQVSPQSPSASQARRQPSGTTKTSAGRRLGGKPADVELSDDSDDSDEEEAGQSSGGGGRGGSRRKSDEQEAFTPTKQAAFAAAVARHQAQLNLKEGAPEAIPFTPRTTRRSMLSTEMSESLRRNLLWERQSRTRLLGMPPGGQQPPQRPPINGGTNSRTTTDLSGFQKSSSQPHIAPKTWQFSGGFHEHGW